MKIQPTEGNRLPATGRLLADLSAKGKEKPKKILVVEDEFLTALNIKEDLILAGYEVPAIAQNGEEAIQKATEVRPDLILMDITLKGTMNGIEAAAAIQKSHFVPVVYLTAHSDSRTVECAKKTGAFGFLVKPCSKVTMMTTIEMALQKHQIDTESLQFEQQTYENELSKRATKLQEANTALKVLLEHRDLERRELEQNIQNNVAKLIIPALRALGGSALTEGQRVMLESIEINLQQLTTKHVSQFGGSLTELSVTEMQVANFVKAGKSTKEIAQFLTVCPSTINTHRDSIRKKLRIKNTKASLKKILQKML